MKVLTFLGTDFDNLCRKLADEVLSNNYTPDLVIGILTGGGIIGRIAYDEFQQKNSNKKILYTEVKLQRPSTKAKAKSNVNKILPKLPIWMLNVMRIAEVYYYEIKVRFVKPKREGKLEPDNAVKLLLKDGGKKVLFIDDCIDTGYTLKIIKEYFMYHFPGNDFRVAVATVSHHFPVVIPEYKLYNRVLLRFPWANDVKRK